jgi:hypothetical protein
MQHRALPDRPEKISVEPQQALDERQFQDLGLLFPLTLSGKRTQ